VWVWSFWRVRLPLDQTSQTLFMAVAHISQSLSLSQPSQITAYFLCLSKPNKQYPLSLHPPQMTSTYTNLQTFFPNRCWNQDSTIWTLALILNPPASVMMMMKRSTSQRYISPNMFSGINCYRLSTFLMMFTTTHRMLVDNVGVVINPNWLSGQIIVILQGKPTLSQSFQR